MCDNGPSPKNDHFFTPAKWVVVACETHKMVTFWPMPIFWTGLIGWQLAPFYVQYFIISIGLAPPPFFAKKKVFSRACEGKRAFTFLAFPFSIAIASILGTLFWWGLDCNLLSANRFTYLEALCTLLWGYSVAHQLERKPSIFPCFLLSFYHMGGKIALKLDQEAQDM